MDVVDETTLTVTSNEVNHQLPFQLTESLAFVASPTAIAQKGADFANAPVGAGPFQLTSWRGTQIEFDRNPGYWDAPATVRGQARDEDDRRRRPALQCSAGRRDHVMTVVGDKYVERARGAG